MAGDVNIFLSERQLEEVEDNTSLIEAELEVMIAGEDFCDDANLSAVILLTAHLLQEPQWRKRGLAIEALSLLIYYASTSPTPAPASSSKAATKYLPLSFDAFLAKVGFDNEASIQLFKKLGFQEVQRSQVWREVELRPGQKGLSVDCSSLHVSVHRWPLL